MPKKLERQLERQAEKKGLSEERKDAYVYGTLKKAGWTPKRKASHNPSDNLVNQVDLGDFIEKRRKI